MGHMTVGNTIYDPDIAWLDQVHMLSRLNENAVMGDNSKAVLKDCTL